LSLAAASPSSAEAPSTTGIPVSGLVAVAGGSHTVVLAIGAEAFGGDVAVWAQAASTTAVARKVDVERSMGHGVYNAWRSTCES
jgi:hypothetical protein